MGDLRAGSGAQHQWDPRRAAACALALVLAACGDDGNTHEPSLGGGGADGSECSQGTFSIESSVRGSSFGSYEGHNVEAHFVGEKRSALIEDGRFAFAFSSPSSTCRLGAVRYEGGALYIDTDDDGTCSAAVDLIFVWVASAPSGTANALTLTPSAPRCFGLQYEGDRSVLAAAQALCPDLGSCLAFCQPRDLLGPGGFAAVCPFPPDGGPDEDAGRAPAIDDHV